MKFTCYLCVAITVIFAICGGVFAFTGFNAIYFACFGNDTVYRSALAVYAVSALFNIYSLIAFKPFKGLK